MNWLTACRELLSLDTTPSCPQLRAALGHVRDGDIDGATAQLEQLDETQRLLATFIVELAAVDAGVDGQALARLCSKLHELDGNLVKLSDLPRRLLVVWAERVGPRLPPAVLAARDGFGGAPLLQRWAVESLCAQGRADAAFAYACGVDGHYREDRAQVWGLVAVGLAADDPRREQALMYAAAAGDARPMIQDGGEESSAHGVAIQCFARGGIAAEHSAVARSVAGLLKLGRTRARKDVRSHGAMSAAVAAALRAVDEGDPAWLDHSEALRKAIWTDDLLVPVDAAILLAERALDRRDAASFVARARELLPTLPTGVDIDEGLVRELAEGRLATTPTPWQLVVMRRAGVDVREPSAAALAQWNGFGRKEVEVFVNGCRLCLDDEALDALLAKISREQERAEALVKGACYGFGFGRGTAEDQDRRRRYLERGYPEGDAFGVYSAELLHLLSPAKRIEGEDYYARHGQSRGLAELAATAMELGDLDGASRAIAKLAQPKTDAAWIPYYRRGNRRFELPQPATPPAPASYDKAGIDAAIKAVDGGEAMLNLARSLVLGEDRSSLAALAKIARLKKWAKKEHAPAVSRVRLITGDLDGGLELLETLGQGRVDDRRLDDAIVGFACELEARGELVDEGVAERLIALFERGHPQFMSRSILTLARVLVLLASAAQRGPRCERLRAASASRYRFVGDRVFVEIGLARGLDGAGERRDAEQAVRTAVTRAGERAMYFRGPSLLRALGDLRALLGDDYEELAVAALMACLSHEQNHYAQVMQVERALRYLWHTGDERATLAWLRATSVPKIIARDVQRSIWADIEHVPEPLSVLEAAWPTEAVTPELAGECIAAAAWALTAVGHEQAEAVAALISSLPESPSN